MLTYAKKFVVSFLLFFGYTLRRTATDSQINVQLLGKLLVEKVSKGVLHIGAHHGQEADFYFSAKKPVIWIEGEPNIHQLLTEKIEQYQNQHSVCALVGSHNADSVNFHLTDNDNQSASIYKLKDSNGFELKNTGTLKLPLIRLDSLFSSEELKDYDYWVIDVQGAELEVLRGAGDLLQIANFVQVEVSTYEVYQDQILFYDVENFLTSKGFSSLHTPEGRFHGDVIFVRNRST